jgi:anaerobic ribonucleoside-triphosphate reductase
LKQQGNHDNTKPTEIRFPNAFKPQHPNNTLTTSKVQNNLSMPQRVRGIRILKAVSSPLRLNILNLLFDKDALSYTELMSSLKMNPSRDAGRFAYHLKFLLKADLIEADVETRKYLLTDLGKMVIDVADRIDKKAFKHKSTLVRTSRPAIEEFDANKIANSLIKEAQMPPETAQNVAKEAEKQLIHAKTKYLTAPLVREVVNAILIQRGLEDYRHKLTRLGIPVHDVISLLESKRTNGTRDSTSVQELAGKTIFKEYALLNVFPRDIADAHLSGALHINGLSSWILKPTEISHDLRFFLEKGLDLENIEPLGPSFPPPHDLESALDLTLNVCLHTAKEVETTQILDYFNIFLAPFAQNMKPEKIKEAFRSLVRNLAQHINASLGLELTIPDFLTKKPAPGPDGKRLTTYSDFTEQAQQIASCLLEVYEEENERKPLNGPSLIIKIRPETSVDERAKALFLKAHSLAAKKGIPYFANATQKNRKQSVFSSSGFRLDADLDGDWETDTLRTGCLGMITMNTPRAAYESEKHKTKFIETLKERIEMSNRAFEIKHRALKTRGKRLLPFIMQSSNGDQYFRLENCSRIVNLAGLTEAAETFAERKAGDEITLTLISELIENISAYIQKTGRRRGKRLSAAIIPSFQASKRLAQADIQRYGIAKVRFSGSREKPFYSTYDRVEAKGDRISQDDPIFRSKLEDLHHGGSLATIDLNETKREPSELVALTNQLVESHTDFWTYDRKLTYCANCKKSWFGFQHKCPSCNAVGTLTFYDRFTNITSQ